MFDETKAMLRAILDERIDNAPNTDVYLAWSSARDIIEYALVDNVECLKEFKLGIDK